MPHFSKIYERVIYNHIIDYIDDNKTLYDKQFEFRKGHSTSHAIITLVKKVAKALDTGKMVVGVYLDIRKAFDCVRHHTLLDKLYKMGIRGNMYCLIENYLIHRTQYVHYNGCDSSTKPIKYGVPQGSILGPLFFILFMIDFSRESEILFLILFADDTSVTIVGTEYTKLIELLNAPLLTQCLTINVLHMLLSLFLLLQIMLFNYLLSFYLQMRLQYFIYELTIVISNG